MTKKGNVILVGANVSVDPVLPVQDARLFAEMIEAYTTRRVGALRHKQKSVDRDISIIADFLRFSGKAPWYWTEGEFEHWSYEIGVVRKLAVSSQRHYQGVIRGFLQYLFENVRFRNEIFRVYGIHLTQICTVENCIPHIDDRELKKERPAFSHEEVSTLFAAFELAILEASRFGAKDLRPLQRDKVMFFTIYAGGLRASEALGMNVGSFQPNPKIPEFGKFGFLSVWGKGSKGSGPRFGLVPVTHAELPPLLDWYIEKVRPNFLLGKNANEEALFLSERGRRLGLSTLEARFQHILEIAGLAGKGFTPHCLRHTSVTHESLRLSILGNQLKHRHKYAATTQGYMHVPDDFVDREIEKVISQHLDTAGKGKYDE